MQLPEEQTQPTQSQETTGSLKKCPFCAEEIQIEAKKCRYCGEFLEGKAAQANKEIFQRSVAIAGSLLLVLAPFAPFLSAPILGRITLFQQGKGDGVFLAVIALVALGYSVFGRYGFLWVSGAFGLFEIGNLLYFFYYRLPVVLENYRLQTKDNPFGGIGDISLSNVDPDWGAIVLLLGTLATLGVAFSCGIRRRMLTVAGMVGLGLCLLVLIYQVVLIWFPYLRYWPELLK